MPSALDRAIAMRRAIVTGASDGIGKSIALKFAKEGYEVILFGRDVDNPFDAPDSPNDYGFGFFLDPVKRGNGLILDAVQQVMTATQDVLHVENFIASYEDNNPENVTVLTRLGFQSTDLTYEEQNNGWVERKYVKEAL